MSHYVTARSHDVKFVLSARVCVSHLLFSDAV